MPSFAEIFSFLFDRGKDVLNAVVDATTNVVLLQIGDCAHPVVDANRAEMWCAGPGFVSIPANPTPGQPSCQVVVVKGGDRDMAIGARDTRAANIYGNAKAGETFTFATTGQAKLMCKQDGSVIMHTTYTNAAGGNSVFFRVKPTAFEFVAPWGKMVFDATGFHVLTQAGTRLDMGGIYGVPAPLSVIASYFTVTAATTKIDSSLVMLGPSISPTGYQPASYGLFENPLTAPPIPIVGTAPGAPIGLICSNSVRIAS
jgi:hypothetical protein